MFLVAESFTPRTTTAAGQLTEWRTVMSHESARGARGVNM